MNLSQPSAAIDLFSTLVAISVVSSIALLIALFIVRLRSGISASLRCQILRLSLILSVAPLLLFAGRVVRNSGEHDSLAVRQMPALVATPAVPESLPKTVFQPSLATEQVLGSDSVSDIAEPQLALSTAQVAEQPAVEVSTTVASSAGSPVAPLAQPAVIASQWELNGNVAHTILTLWLAITGTLLLVQLVRLTRSTLYWRRKLAGHVCDNDQANFLAGIGDLNNVRVVCRDDIQIPMVVGVFRPVILFPTDLGKTTPTERRMIVRHECQHIARRDILWDLVGSALTAMIWFQPLAWVVLRQIRIEREIACDDAVLRDVDRPREYAQLLTTLARAAVQPHVSQVMVATMAVRSQMERRVIAILNLNRCGYQKRSTRLGVLASFGMMVSVLAVLLLAQLPEIRAAATSPRRAAATPQQAAADKPAERPQRSAVDSSEQPTPEGYFRIRGRVVDEQGAGVVGAKVFVEGRDRKTPTAVTKAGGNYEVLVPVISDRQRQDHVISVRVTEFTRGMMGAVEFGPWSVGLNRWGGQPRPVPDVTISVPPTVPVTVTDKNGIPVSDAFVGTVQSETVLCVVKSDENGQANVPLVHMSSLWKNKAATLLFALKNGEGIAFQELPAGEGIQPVSIGLAGASPMKVYAQVAEPVDGDMVYAQFGTHVWNQLRSYGPASGVQVLPVFYDDTSLAAIRSFACSSLASPFCPVTDDQGLALIEWMPANSVWRRHVETTDARYFYPEGAPAQRDGDVARLTVEPMIEVGGVVIDNQDKPLENATVECRWSGLSREIYLRGNVSVLTDSAGKFRFRVPGGTQVDVYAQSENAFSSAVRFETMNAKFGKRVIADEYKKLRLTIGDENRIFGVVTSGPNRIPLPGIHIVLTRFVDNSDRVRFLPPIVPDPRGDVSSFRVAVQTDENGRYEFTTSDGEWLMEDPLKEPRKRNWGRGIPNATEHRFSVSGGLETRQDFHSDTLTQLTIYVDSEKQKAEQARAGRLAALGDRPMSKEVYWPWRKVLRRKPRAIEVAGAYIAWDGNATQLTVTPGAKVKVSGRLTTEQGQPAGIRSIRYVVHPQVLDGFPLPSPVTDTISGQIDSNEDGTFELNMFLKDCECEIQVTADEGVEWAKQRWVAVKKFTPSSDAPIDVGDLTVPPVGE